MTAPPLSPIIAIDGPTASGKGTLSKRIAAHYGFAHLDTGALYRAVGYSVLEAGHKPADEAAALNAAQTLNLAIIADIALRNDTVGAAASIVAAMPSVRTALLDFQRNFAKNPPHPAKGAVLDGRDIGTVICPDATVKLFVTADVLTRARRRALEFKARGLAVDDAQILADLEARDKRDSERAAAPLKPATGAHLLDTSQMDIEQAFAAACAIIDQAVKS